MSDLLKDQLDRALRGMVSMPLLRAAEQGIWPVALDQGIAGLGMDTALVPEAQGGADLAWADLGGAFEALGFHAVPIPLGEAILAQWALARLGLSRREDVALALDTLTFGARSTVSGSTQVPFGRDQSLILADVDQGGQTLLALIDASGAQSASLATVGRDPAVRLDLKDAAVLASVPAGVVSLGSALAVLRAAQITGALSRILELSIDYGNTREQFGRPIGKFQAVQHLIAELAGEAACAKAGVQLALAGFDSGGGWEHAAIAKIRASAAVTRGTFAAHEVHGAIGVTEEHMLHYFTRRLWQWRDEAGTEHHWAERLGRSLLAPGPAPLWPRTVALSNA